MQIDYGILADHAEVLNNKLYLMGGGWDTMAAPQVPAAVRLVLAVGLRVEWDETGQQIPVVIRVSDEDAQELLRLNGQMTVGRPKNLVPGASQLSQVSFVLNMKLPKFGGFIIGISAGQSGAEVRHSLPFRLITGPARTVQPKRTTPEP